MKNAVRGIALCMVWLVAGACRNVPFEPTQLVSVGTTNAEHLVSQVWTLQAGVLRCRQTGLLEVHGREMPLSAFMELDPGKQTLRLVGMSDLGVTLFDLAVSDTDVETHFVIPEMRRRQGVAEAVGECARRVFLAPAPDVSDVLETRRNHYVLSRAAGTENEVQFIFGGQHRLLLEKRSRGHAGSWRVRYFEYTALGDEWIPGGIIYEDKRIDLRLTLSITDVKRLSPLAGPVTYRR